MDSNYDFFISYNHNDEAHAKWIAWILEEAGYRVFIQAWDFRPGNNIVLQMQKGAANASCTLALLSNNYMLSQFTQPEWAAAFGADPTGNESKLIPILVEDFKLEGLLPQIVYINLVGKNEEEAKQAILNGVQFQRAKPTIAPPFPGVIPKRNTNKDNVPETWYAPWIDQRIEELDKGNFNNSIMAGAKFVLHLLPIESISTNKKYELKEINDPLKLKPFYTCGWDHKVNKDGFCTFAVWPNSNTPHAYVQFFRNGIIESIDMGILKPRDNLKYIPFVKFEKDIIEYIRNYYLKALRSIDIKLPIAVNICLLDIEGYYISINPKYPKDIISQSTLKLPTGVINSWEDDIAKVLKPTFDMLWNYCGFEGSLNYDEIGNWREYRGY